MVLAAVTWLGQDFGAILTGQGTDPNSGPLLFLLTLAYWPIRPQHAPGPAVATRRPPLLRAGIGVTAAALVAASSVAAATGITTRAARASTSQARVTATGAHMLGPGPVLARYQLAGYHILFGDSRNRATHPGTLSIELSQGCQPIQDAGVTLGYHSLDMAMPTHTVDLRPLGQGLYSHHATLLGMGGRWRITITVLPQRGPELRLTLTDLIAL